MAYYVYILAKGRNRTFYVGMTSDLPRRISEHKRKLADGFTKQYGIDQFVYYEMHDEHYAALRREKLIKRWRRSYKMNAIEAMNPDWRDLFEDICV